MVLSCYPALLKIFGPIGNWLYLVSPALVSLGIGGFTIQRIFIRRANAATFVDAIIKELEVLKEDALKYWNIDPNDDDGKECHVLEQRIKGSIKSIYADIQHLCVKYWDTKTKEELDVLMVDVAHRTTGGDFESKNRKPDPVRYMYVVNTINEMRSRLMMTKL